LHESLLRHPLYQIPNHETIEKNTKYRKSKNRNKLILNPGIIDCILTKLLISTNNQTHDRLDLILFLFKFKNIEVLKGTVLVNSNDFLFQEGHMPIYKLQQCSL